MHGLEYGAHIYIGQRSNEKFERVFQQLTQFYIIPKIRSESKDRQFLIGLYLMYLLTKNRLDDFHTELELLEDDDLKNEYISFSMNIETYLMDGSYNKILAISSKKDVNFTNKLKTDPRYEKFEAFLSDLKTTVRNEVADSLEAVHDTMPIQDVLKLLLLSNVKTLEKWISDEVSCVV